MASEYDFSTLFSHWKIDVGFGLRAMVAGGVIRMDWAFSDESNHIWFMVGHPF